MQTKRGTRSDYTPSVRPRSAREDGARRLTPGYLDDLSDTKVHVTTIALGVITRQNIATPPAGFALRVIRLKVMQNVTDGPHYFEVYFGSAVNMMADQPKVIDLLLVPDLGAAATRTWGRGAGPVGQREEVLSVRPISATANLTIALIEYTLERAR